MASQRSRVEVYAKFTAVSGKPIGQVAAHPLGPRDLAMSLHTLHMVFYYPNIWVAGPLESDRLRTSLSEVLSRYALATGRLVRPDGGNWEVKLNDAGVRVLRARVGATLNEWLRSADAAEERDLTAWEEMPEDPFVWAPFQIQVTHVNEFQGGTVAIGLSCPHLLADPFSAILLFKSWADYHRGQPSPQPTFIHPTALSGRSQIPNAGAKSAFFNVSNKSKAPPVGMATATFRFSNSMMEQWLSKVHDKYFEATPFHFLAALFWTRVSKLKPPSPRDENTHRLSLCLNSRKLMMNADEYFGNALKFSLLSLDAEEMKEMDLERVAGLVLRHMSGLEDGVEWEPMTHTGEDGKYASPSRVYGLELTCIDMEQFVPSIYEAAMLEEGEKPVHISCRIGNLGGEGLIMVMPSPENGLGRTVTVTLLKEQMGKLCEDEAILSLQPTMLLN